MTTLRAVTGAVALLLVVLDWPPPARAQELTLSVAISMRDAVQEVGGSFPHRHLRRCDGYGGPACAL